MPLPPTNVTAEQRTAALAKALEVRRARSVLLAEVREHGVEGLVSVLARSDDGDQAALRLRVLRLLRALPGIGPVRARRLLERLSIPENRRVRGLGPNQRAALLEAVDGKSQG
ncbi:integration host factor, actinobacterial type [Streptomyces sp. NPDC005393]|uniref:integration host factor, actinobacterial type n=1 Tax=Streptomyces sp. NPDC005393 TaxID=3157041 RepID=UPI0033A87B96